MTEIRNVNIDELEFECRVSGNEKDELVVLLHGFPETSFMWKKLMPELASLGFYCIAPNMRGYSKYACPKGKSAYTIKKISQDILDITKSLGKDKFHLIGHDWGAAIGWNIAYKGQDKILSWSALSVPHNSAFGKAIKLDKDQKKRSRYIAWFLIPFLPEIMVRKNDFARFRRLWKHSSTEEVNDYLSVFRRKQSLTGALNYYRANIGRSKNERIGEIRVPTLFIWGKNDMAIGAFAAESNHKYMKGDYTFLELDGGHWLIQSNYSDVKTAIIEHLSKHKTVLGNI